MQTRERGPVARLLAMALFALSMFCACANAAIARAPPGGDDDRKRWDTLGREGAPVVSPDGQWLALTMLVPTKSGTGEQPGQDDGRNLADGTLSTFKNSRLFVNRLSASGIPNALEEVSPCFAWAPSWSPDGRQVAYYSNEAGMVNLWLYDTQTKKRRRVSDARLYSRSTNTEGPNWSPDGLYVYVPVVTATTSDDKLPPNPYKWDTPALLYAYQDNDYSVSKTAIAEIRVSDGSLVLLPTNGNINFLRSGAISPSGKWLIALTDEFQLSVISLKERTLRKIGQMQALIVDSAFTGTDLFTGPYWAPDADRLAYLVENRPYVIDLTDRTDASPLQLATNLKHIQWNRNSPLAYSADGSMLAGPVIDGDDLKAVFIPVDGSAGKEVTLLSGLRDRNIFTGEATGATFNLGSLRVKPNILWQPSPTAVYFQYPDHPHQEIVVIKVDWANGEASEAQRWLSTNQLVGSGPRPGEALVIHEGWGTARNLLPLRPDLGFGPALLENPEANPVLAASRVDRFSTRVVDMLGDFREVGTTVIRPASTQASAPAAVVCVYPGSNSSSSIRRYSAGTVCTIPISSLLSRGYAVVLADILDQPPGMRVYGEHVRARQVTDSIVPQIYKAGQLGLIDVERLVVLGHSQGGLAALQIASTTPLFRGAIGLSGVRYSPTEQSFGWHFDDWYLDRVNFTGDLSEVLENSPYLRASKIRSKVLLAHGEVDIFSVRASDLMAQALKDAGKDVQYARYPGEGHDIGKWSDRTRADLQSRILSFLGAAFAEHGE